MPSIIFWTFTVLVQAWLTASYTGLDIYYSKLSIRVVSWAAKQLKTYRRKYQKILKIGWTHRLTPSLSFRNEFLALPIKDYEKADIIASVLSNFTWFSTFGQIFLPGKTQILWHYHPEFNSIILPVKSSKKSAFISFIDILNNLMT